MRSLCAKIVLSIFAPKCLNLNLLIIPLDSLLLVLYRCCSRVLLTILSVGQKSMSLHNLISSIKMQEEKTIRDIRKIKSLTSSITTVESYSTVD